MTNDAAIIACLDFGNNRAKEHPNVFFCAQHKNWDDLGPTKGLCKRNSQCFKCTANH